MKNTQRRSHLRWVWLVLLLGACGVPEQPPGRSCPPDPRESTAISIDADTAQSLEVSGTQTGVPSASGLCTASPPPDDVAKLTIGLSESRFVVFMQLRRFGVKLSYSVGAWDKLLIYIRTAQSSQAQEWLVNCPGLTEFIAQSERNGLCVNEAPTCPAMERFTRELQAATEADAAQDAHDLALFPGLLSKIFLAIARVQPEVKCGISIPLQVLLRILARTVGVTKS